MKTTRKQARKNRIIELLNEELSGLYHNATIHKWGEDVAGCISFYDWLMDAGPYEVEYLNDGGSTGKKCYTTFTHIKEKAAAFKSEAARARFLRNTRRQFIEERKYIECRIHEYGEIYSYGRGGRTLAPEGWTVNSHRGFNARQYEPEDLTLAGAAVLLRDVQAFNSYIRSWCAYAPEAYREHCINELENDIHHKREELHGINREALPLIREIKSAGRAFSPAVCKVLTDELKTRLSRRRSLINELQSSLNTLRGLNLCASS